MDAAGSVSFMEGYHSIKDCRVGASFDSGARKHFMSLVFLVDTVGRASLIERTSFRRGLRSRYLVRIEMGIHAGVAQLVEHLTCNEAVVGSSPVSSMFSVYR